MTGPERRTVRVRRSPKVGVFLAIGAVAGAIAALLLTSLLPSDPRLPTPQAFGFLVLMLAPVGALLAGVVAVVVDARSERRARTMEAELLPGTEDDREV